MDRSGLSGLHDHLLQVRSLAYASHQLVLYMYRPLHDRAPSQLLLLLKFSANQTANWCAARPKFASGSLRDLIRKKYLQTLYQQYYCQDLCHNSCNICNTNVKCRLVYTKKIVFNFVGLSVLSQRRGSIFVLHSLKQHHQIRPPSMHQQTKHRTKGSQFDVYNRGFRYIFHVILPDI
jgi:hypothetical protein